MKSRTSFFNLTLYKKDITRFAPLWVIYTIGMLLIMLSLSNVTGQSDDYAVTVRASIGLLSMMNLVYALIIAQLLFGELFNTRLCNALHAMPVRREARFSSHLLAGISFSFVPNLLVCRLMLLPMGHWAFTSFLWLLGVTLHFLFFFGVAIFAMFCTGNRFAAVLVYLIINFGAMAALWFADVIFVPLMRGVILDWEAFAYFSPVVCLVGFGKYYDIRGVENDLIFYWEEGWLYLSICAVVGVALMAVSLLLYRRRALECAGDFMAVKAMKPVFLALYTLCIGVFFALFGSIFGDEIYVLFLIVGMVIGFFTGKMLLERTARVFRLKSFLQLGIFVVVMWLALMAVQFDVFGIERYVPDPDAVKRAEVTTYYYGGNRITVTDPEELKILQQAHKLAIEEEGCKHEAKRQTYYLTYYMKDGRTVKREYTLCEQEAAAEKMKVLYGSPKAILGIDGEWEDYIKAVTSIYVEGFVLQNYLNAEDWESFLNCVYEDCENGLMSGKGKPSKYTVTVWRGGKTVSISIRENATSFEWLEAYEEKLLEQYIQTAFEITLGGWKIDQERYEDLLTTIYEDCKEYNIFWNGEYENGNTRYEIRIRTSWHTPVTVIYVPEYADNTVEWIKNYILEKYPLEDDAA